MNPDETDSIPDRGALDCEFERLKPLYQSLLGELERLVHERLESEGLHPTITGRVKSFESIYQKKIRLLREAKLAGRSAPLPINDIVGLRIVCPFLGDLAETEKIIGRHFTVTETERKGAERSFREFGYESIHLLVKIPVELNPPGAMMDLELFEIQLRTILQEAWAEVEHELVYKAEFTPFDEPMKRKLAALNANLSLSDIIFQEIREYQRRLAEELARRRSAFYQKVEESIDEPLGRSAPVRRARYKEGVPSSASESPEFDVSRSPSEPASKIRESENGEISRGDASLDDLLLEALYAHNRGDYTRAIRIYGLILDGTPPKEAAAVVIKHRGMAYFSESRYEEAIADFSRTLELDPDCYRAAYFRGVARSVLGNYGAALEDFDLSIRINPFQFFATYRRAQVYWHLGDYPKVIADCETALKIEPEQVQVEELKSLALAKLEL